MAREQFKVDHVEVRGARVHNLKGIDVDIPLGELVGIAGVSGSGKSSLALGVLYAEGSRRYLESLSTYTRRRMTTASEANVDSIRYIPASLALHQRPAVPGIRSTFGTATELLNSLRLLFSRLGCHRCPNGHLCPPSTKVALEQEIICPTCGAHFYGPSAESFAFNSEGACPDCGGTGTTIKVDESTLVPDWNKTIDEGAVAPWNSLMWSLMVDICRAMGVRTDVPFKNLTDEEREIVYHGPAVKKHILYHSKKTEEFAEMDFTYYSAVHTVENALSKVKDESGMKRVAKFLKQEDCPTCQGTRLSAKARSTILDGRNLAEATAMTLDDSVAWVRTLADKMPEDMREMARTIAGQFLRNSARLIELGLGYLTLDRTSATLSTGERQRVQLARAVRNQTTGVLYVLDEPSIGLHPDNVTGLLGMVDDLIANGNSVVMVDHDTRVLRRADHLVELGPGAGASGGTVLTQGTVSEVEADPTSLIGPFLSGQQRVEARQRCRAEDTFALGKIVVETGPLHTVQPLTIEIPKGRLTAVTGVSGSGKTTAILESLVPGLKSAIEGSHLPSHVRRVEAGDIQRVNLIDATPIGANVRSTVSTYSGVLDDLRKLFAASPAAKAKGRKAGDFSYNTGSLRCPTCDGTGEVTLDVQFLPDVELACPDCRGSRYGKEALDIRWTPKGSSESYTLPYLLSLTVDQALAHLSSVKVIKQKLEVLSGLGLGYLTLGEATPSLSGGEAQRLKLAAEMGRMQSDALFVFDEPTIGLHPKDVKLLINILQRLIDAGATVVVIEHDLDMIANADHIIDMGPRGGKAGGRIIAQGTPEQIASDGNSITGRYLAEVISASKDR